MIDSKSAFPFFVNKSTESRLAHFDETVFAADSSTVIYKIVDALCGDVGAGMLSKEALMTRFSAALDTMYFSDLDYLFGGIDVLARVESESYPYDPKRQMLTSDQWDEVKIKDAWYRARIRDFFEAATFGGTPRGVRAAVQACTSSSADIFEVWRYKDNFGIKEALGRAPVSTRSEFVVKPHKSVVSPKHRRLLKQILDRISPRDTVVTVDNKGIAASIPVSISSSSADSAYFEVQKEVTPSPILQNIPAPELLAIDLDETEKWLFSKSPELAPYAAFNITQEYGYYYLVSGGDRSPIDTVEYMTTTDSKKFYREKNYESVTDTSSFTEWIYYDKADSPDNYPGGKYGLTPLNEPAITPQGRPYPFAYASQQEYINEVKKLVIEQGGHADNQRYRLPIGGSNADRFEFKPELAVAYSQPSKDSTVTTGWNNSDRKKLVKAIFNPTNGGVKINAGLVY